MKQSLLNCQNWFCFFKNSISVHVSNPLLFFRFDNIFILDLKVHDKTLNSLKCMYYITKIRLYLMDRPWLYISPWSLQHQEQQISLRSFDSPEFEGNRCICMRTNNPYKTRVLIYKNEKHPRLSDRMSALPYHMYFTLIFAGLSDCCKEVISNGNHVSSSHNIASKATVFQLWQQWESPICCTIYMSSAQSSRLLKFPQEYNKFPQGIS